jgi:hypothetical protein
LYQQQSASLLNSLQQAYLTGMNHHVSAKPYTVWDSPSYEELEAAYIDMFTDLDDDMKVKHALKHSEVVGKLGLNKIQSGDSDGE